MSDKSVDALEREGDIAADYLEGLLDIADLDGDIDMDVEGDRAMVSITGGNLGNLIGQKGSLQTSRLAQWHDWSMYESPEFPVATANERNGAYMLAALAEGVALVRDGHADAVEFLQPAEEVVRVWQRHVGSVSRQPT